MPKASWAEVTAFSSARCAEAMPATARHVIVGKVQQGPCRRFMLECHAYRKQPSSFLAQTRTCIASDRPRAARNSKRVSASKSANKMVAISSISLVAPTLRAELSSRNVARWPSPAGQCLRAPEGPAVACRDVRRYWSSYFSSATCTVSVPSTVRILARSASD